MKDIIKNAISPYTNYCEGYGNSQSSGNSYLLGLAIGIGVVDAHFNHSGSRMLDEINAFDLAETDGAYIGQLNMSIVSSFCGPQGLVWGLDVAKHPAMQDKTKILEFTAEYNGISLPAYDGMFLIEATQKLFGTADERRFILRPGAHVPFAGKNMKLHGPGTIYSAIAIGIPEDAEHNARLLMEDIGKITGDTETAVQTIKSNLAKSIIQVGLNQRVKFKECYIALKYTFVPENKVGCALVAAPYFTIAQNALPINKENNTINYERFLQMDLIQWEKEIIYGTISTPITTN